MPSRREIELARHLRRHATPAERTAWELLRDRRCEGVKFKRQHPIAGFIVDFYAPVLRLAVELDGGIHDEADQVARDEMRTAELESEGLVVVRLRNAEVNAVRLAEIVRQARNAPPLRRVSDGEGAGG